MASDQELSVKITGDSGDLTSATDKASKALGDLANDIKKVDQETIEVTPDIELSRINRDLANLRKSLDVIERQKVSPDANIDLTQLLRDQKRVQKAIDDLEKDKVEIEAEVQVDASGLAGLQTMFTRLGAAGGEIKFLPASLGDVVSYGSKASGTLKTLAGDSEAAGAAAGTAAAGGVAALAVGIGYVGYESGMAAADIETLQVQLDALTGGRGIETLAFLQSWAKETPFEIADAADATRKLAAAGVDLDQIPTYLNDIGNVAAATGVPLEQIATVFGQMESKGRASYEELQQLAEAGIPVWQTLADALGVTVAEAQKMATEGKLTADSIDLVRQALSKKYSTAMGDQAETLNGQLSSLRDTFTQTWQALGTLSLPALKTGADMLQDFADIIQDFVRIYVWAYDELKAVPFLDVLITGVENAGKSLGWLKDRFDDVADTVTGTDDDASTLGSTFEEEMATADDAVAEVIPTVEDLQQALQDAAAAFAGIGGAVRTKVDFIISADDLKEEIRKTIEGVNEKGTDNDIPPVELPANLTLGKIAGLGDEQQNLVGNISDFVQQGLEEGARRAEIVPGFDDNAWYAKIREQTRGLLIDAGVDPKNINQTLTTVFGLPRTVPVDADTTEASAAVNAMSGKRIAVVPFAAPGPLDSLLYGDAALPATPAPIAPAPVAADVASTNTSLAAVAMPGGAARVADIKVIVDPISLSSASSVLTNLAEDRYATIYVNTVRSGSGGDGGGPTAGGQSLVPQLFGATDAPALAGLRTVAQQSQQLVAATGTYGVKAPVPQGGTVTQLAPRQTPIKVYLDGAEIADHLTLKAGRLATASSIRRRA